MTHPSDGRPYRVSLDRSDPPKATPRPPIAIPDGFTRKDLLACIDRELALRERVYPRQVALGHMSDPKARNEIAAMRAVRAVLAQVPEPPAIQPSLFGGKP